jgi:hypothetical protein
LGISRQPGVWKEDACPDDYSPGFTMRSLKSSVNSEEKVLPMEMKRFPNSYRDTQDKDRIQLVLNKAVHLLDLTRSVLRFQLLISLCTEVAHSSKRSKSSLFFPSFCVTE